MTDWDAARRLLEGDQIWCAYALADLDSHLRQLCDVWMEQDSLLLRFRGLTPSVLFAYGEPAAVYKMCEAIEPKRYIFTFDIPTRSALRDLLQVESENEMHRMVYSGSELPVKKMADAQPLSLANLNAIQDLMAGHDDRPDAFDPSQLDHGCFFGVWREGSLVAMAGTHVLSTAMGVAAIGNVFTHPDWRGKGWGRSASAAVLSSLVERGIPTIVLNTQVENHAAIQLYRGLGFESYCHYMEGIALAPAGVTEKNTHSRRGRSA
jgi:ribosomal protein S18 acetylase RimI-like enzyme